MGTFKRSEMLYNDGKYYKWTAAADQDNPNYRHGTDRKELDRTEGYEVLPFINKVGDDYWAVNTRPTLEAYQKIEKMIRYDVPSKTQDREEIAQWIIDNWSKH